MEEAKGKWNKTCRGPQMGPVGAEKQGGGALVVAEVPQCGREATACTQAVSSAPGLFSLPNCEQMQVKLGLMGRLAVH